MTEEEKEAVEQLEQLKKDNEILGLSNVNKPIETTLNLIQKQQAEIEKLKKVLDDRFIYVTGARTVYDRLMSLDKEIIVKDDLKLRNEIQRHINELGKKDKLEKEVADDIDKVAVELSKLSNNIYIVNQAMLLQKIAQEKLGKFYID